MTGEKFVQTAPADLVHQAAENQHAIMLADIGLTPEQIARNTAAYKHCLESMPGVLHEWAERTGRVSGTVAAGEAVAICNEAVKLDARDPIYPNEDRRR